MTYPRLPELASCPIRSEFITNLHDAVAYYRFRMVGDHRVSVGNRQIIVRFQKEEIHTFTDAKAPNAFALPITRPGKNNEVRFFSIVRARAFDLILDTIAKPARALRAREAGKIAIYGPAATSGRRLCVIVAPTETPDVFFVRTAYDVDPKAFNNALRGRSTPWPPK